MSTTNTPRSSMRRVLLGLALASFMVAAPTAYAALPKNDEARAVVRAIYHLPARAQDGRIVFVGKWCRANFEHSRTGGSRDCHVRITGNAPRDLRVRVWEKGDNYVARTWAWPVGAYLS